MAIEKKGNQPTQPAKEDPKDMRVQQQEAETDADLMARTSLMPTVQAALTLMDYNKDFGEMSINVLVTDLGKQCELASKGDLARTEALLMAQAHTLDAIFHKLARKATDVEYSIASM
jgi:very-short-patch-repair endonuclease